MEVLAVVIIVIEEWAVALTVKTFDPYTRDEMASVITGPYHSLDLGAPLILGRPPRDFDYNVQSDRITFTPFTGCLRNVVVNERLLDFSSPLAEVDVTRGCGFSDAVCNPNPCGNGGRCIGEWSSYFCDCPVEFSGPECLQDAESASFFGDSFIRYQLQTAVAVDRPARQTNESSVYRTGQNFISLAFQTSMSSGTLLQLGDPVGSSEYAVLEIVEGRLQFRYNLGSGETTASLRQATAVLNDAAFHEVSVRRIEEQAVVVVDDRYVARSTSPGSETTLDIPSNMIYLGATVSAVEGTSQGFSGCLWGIKLDRKDLPIAAATEDFIPFLSPGVDITCPGLGPLSESDPIAPGYIYGGLAGILALLLVITMVCVLCRVLGRRKKGSHQLTTGGRDGEEGRGSPTAFAWQPAKREDYHTQSFNGSVSTEGFSGGNLNMNNLNGRPVSPQLPSTSTLDATPVISETAFVEPETKLLPQRAHARRQQRQQAGRVSEGRGQTNEIHVTNPGYTDDSPDSGDMRRAYRHRRPSSPSPISPTQEEPTQAQGHRQPQPAPKPPVTAKPSQTHPHHQNHRRPSSPVSVPIPVEPRQEPRPMRSLTQNPVEEPTQAHNQHFPDSANPRQAAPFHPRHPNYSPTPADDTEGEDTTQVLHVRSSSALSGHQSLGGKSDTSSLQDDSEVGKYIRKRIEEADLQIEELNLDEMRPYKIEGVYEPLGSIGSLYDIIAEADKSALGQSFSLSPDPTPVHSRDPSKSSMEGSSHMGDYSKKLDNLMERFHNLTAGLSPEQYDEGRLV